MSKINYLSQEGYDNLVAELEHLKTVGRAAASKAIGEAREKGDLSENAEYDAAKDAQGLLELKINNLEKIMATAQVLDASQLDNSQVVVMSTVKMKNQATGKDVSYTIVSESEANLKEKKISISSPIGVGLLGKKVGEIATVKTPRGDIKFEVLDIQINL